jgi:hypothetical protein
MIYHIVMDIYGVFELETTIATNSAAAAAAAAAAPVKDGGSERTMRALTILRNLVPAAHRPSLFLLRSIVPDFQIADRNIMGQTMSLADRVARLRNLVVEIVKLWLVVCHNLRPPPLLIVIENASFLDPFSGDLIAFIQSQLAHLLVLISEYGDGMLI